MSSERRRELFRRQRERRAQRAEALRQAELAATPVREVTMTELARHPAVVVRGVREGEV